MLVAASLLIKGEADAAATAAGEVAAFAWLATGSLLRLPNVRIKATATAPTAIMSAPSTSQIPTPGRDWTGAAAPDPNADAAGIASENFTVGCAAGDSCVGRTGAFAGRCKVASAGFTCAGASSSTSVAPSSRQNFIVASAYRR